MRLQPIKSLHTPARRLRCWLRAKHLWRHHAAGYDYCRCCGERWLY